MRGIRPHGNKYRVDVGGYLGLYETREKAKEVRDEALKAFAGPFAVVANERKVS